MKINFNDFILLHAEAKEKAALKNDVNLPNLVRLYQKKI